VSAAELPVWHKGRPNALRFIAPRPRATPGAYLPDCPAGHVRVAVLIPPRRIPEAYTLAGSRFGEVVGNGDVLVRVFGRVVVARTADPSDRATIAVTKARHVVTMPVETGDE